MASINTENSVAGDKLLFREFMPHLNIPPEGIQSFLDVVEWGGLALETFFEQAISNISNVKRSNITGQDFVNGWEAKKCTVIFHTHGSKSTVNREANISNLHRKHGEVLIAAADTLSNQVFYFKVPAHEIKDRKSITITFDINGGALKTFRKVDGSVKNSFSWRMWNLYRKSSLIELCQTTASAPKPIAPPVSYIDIASFGILFNAPTYNLST